MEDRGVGGGRCLFSSAGRDSLEFLTSMHLPLGKFLPQNLRNKRGASPENKNKINCGVVANMTPLSKVYSRVLLFFHNFFFVYVIAMIHMG